MKSKKLKKFAEKRIRKNTSYRFKEIYFVLDKIQNKIENENKLLKSKVDELTASIDQLTIELFELKNEVYDQEFERKLKEKEDEKQD